MNRSLASAAVVLFALSAHAQTSATPSTATTPPPQPATAGSLPSDPAALLQLASQVNGLHGADLQPWHIKASWRMLDENKKVKDQGTWEEWWAGEEKYKIIASSGRAQQTVYGTGHGVFVVTVKSEVDPAEISGASDIVPVAYFAAVPDSVPAAEFLLERLLTHPVPEFTSGGLAHTRLQPVRHQENGAFFQCVLQSFLLPDGNPHLTADKDGKFFPSINRYCFDNQPPVLRIESSPGQIITFDSLVRFQNRYLARSIRIVHAAIQTSLVGNLIMPQRTRAITAAVEADIRVDVVEPLTALNEADFNPPADAMRVTDLRASAIAGGVMAGQEVSGSFPAYTEQAREWYIGGKVEVGITILQDGTVGHLKVISGPTALQQAALDAVKTWRFEPFLLNGQPVNVEAQMTVVFSPIGR